MTIDVKERPKLVHRHMRWAVASLRDAECNARKMGDEHLASRIENAIRWAIEVLDEVDVSQKKEEETTS